MRHWVRGALGVAVVYPLIWYYSVPDPLSPAAAAGPQVLKAGARSAAPAPSSPPTFESAVLERRVAPRGVTERLPAATRGGPASEPELPRLPTVEDPTAPVAVMPELREVMARAGEVQRHAHNPGELEEQLQTFQEDPVKLAKLRALAEMFLQLPPPRGESYLPSSSGSQPSTAR